MNVPVSVTARGLIVIESPVRLKFTTGHRGKFAFTEVLVESDVEDAKLSTSK